MTALDEDAVDRRLTQIFRAVFEDESLSIHDGTTAADIEEWDSLNNIKLVIEIEKAFAVKFTLQEIVPLRNVGDLKALLRRHGV